VGVIRNDAEAGVGCVFLHNPAKSHLGGRSHGVGFVEDDEFEGGDGGVVGGFGHAEYLLCACIHREPDMENLCWTPKPTCEGLNLLSHNIYASIVACIEF